eukprot:GHVU01026505.1.p1 GENE.GHVU01026505.1~~GHVU01026505.1.p1  ORF type:complete len:277 (-),score=9.49 GHVU01026505.1:219-1049(-)
MGARTPRQCNEASLCCRCPGVDTTDGDKVVGHTAVLLRYAAYINTDAKTPFYDVSTEGNSPAWIFPKITGTSANANYLKAVAAINGYQVHKMRAALNRYKNLCGPEADGGAADPTQTTSELTRADPSVAKACSDFDRIWKHCSQKLDCQKPNLKEVAEKLSNDSSDVAVKYLRRMENRSVMNDVGGFPGPPARQISTPGFEEGKTDEGWACPSADLAANVARLCVLCRGCLRVEYIGLKGPASFSLALRRHLVCTTRQPRVAAAWSVIAWAPAPRV